MSGKSRKPFKHIAPAVKEPAAGAYKRFIDMGTERQLALDQLLHQDKPFTDIVKILQGEWGEFLDVKPDTLNKNLQRYKAKYLIPRWQNAQAKVAAGVVGNEKEFAASAKRMRGKLDVMDCYEELIDIQRDRILKVYEREKKMPDGIVLDSLNKLFRDYSNSLNQYSNLQMETGVVKRAPKVITGQLGIGETTETPTFEMAFQLQEQAVAGFAALGDIMQEVIEGEFSNVTAGVEDAAPVEPASTDVPAAAPTRRKASRKPPA